MQVVSGPIGREKVHFEAPPAQTLHAQTKAFLKWFNAAPVGDALVHAGLAHLWLMTLHPFDNGNDRISRAVGDMALARAKGLGQRFYSSAGTARHQRLAGAGGVAPFGGRWTQHGVWLGSPRFARDDGPVLRLSRRTLGATRPDGCCNFLGIRSE